jgi:hypothetical protein
MDRWDELAAQLGDRPGWRFEGGDELNAPMWCIGIEGAARLVVTVESDTALIYDVDNDHEHRMPVDQVASWLDEHELEHRSD